MRTETETDMTKLIVVFRNSAKAPKNKAWVMHLKSLRNQIPPINHWIKTVNVKGGDKADVIVVCSMIRA